MSVYSWIYTGRKTEADLLRAVDLQSLRAEVKCVLGETCEIATFQSKLDWGAAILVSYANVGQYVQDAEEWLRWLAETLGQAPKVYTTHSGAVQLFGVRGRPARTLEHAALPHPDEL